MNEDVKAQWLEALRSGDYDQGVGYLQRGGKFCCLGVLCDLAVKAKEVVVEEYEEGRFTYGSDHDSNDATLPRAVMEWSGIETEGGIFEAPVGRMSYRRLWELNDDAKMSFEEIADVIEAQF